MTLMLLNCLAVELARLGCLTRAVRLDEHEGAVCVTGIAASAWVCHGSRLLEGLRRLPDEALLTQVGRIGVIRVMEECGERVGSVQ